MTKKQAHKKAIKKAKADNCTMYVVAEPSDDGFSYTFHTCNDADIDTWFEGATPIFATNGYTHDHN